MARTGSRPELPAVLAGPIVRRLQAGRITLWIAARASASIRLELFPPDTESVRHDLTLASSGLTCLKAGEHLWYLLVDLRLDSPLPEEVLIPYRLSLLLDDAIDAGWQDHSVWAANLCYPGRDLPFMRIPRKVSSVMHGSCRKPHGSCADGLITADEVVEAALKDEGHPDIVLPDLLVLSGDQVYMDDVAGPMVQAVTALAATLGLPDETLDGVDEGLPASGQALGKVEGLLYRRDRMLPRIDQNASVFDVLFGGTRKPVFTSQHARNHLITLAEMLAMYLLVWSPDAWAPIPKPRMPAGLSDKDRAMYTAEQAVLEDFVAGLPKVRRLLAHVPTAMIFDDHDVTDDWNLSLAWEEAAYGHPLSRRVIGNALIAYGIHQGWGNRPEMIGDDLGDVFRATLEQPGSETHEAAIDAILDYEKWDFEWPTDPPLIALDTRTRRWRSERNAHYPSGLLDWEAVTDLQARLRNRDAVLLVSAAPIFGVKLIESIQKFFTMIGKPLMVDAEYWMAHPGTANAVLNVFQHRNTPSYFIILSGDVHYSFVYDVELRRGRSSRGGQSARNPKIWQICSSGLKNKWPDKLIAILDHGNRWAFGPRSPLNLFTRRRGMRVIPRKPVGTPHGRRILNASGIGLVELNDEGAPVTIRQISSEGQSFPFERREREARLD